MVCHTFQPLFDYTAGQFVNNSIVSLCGGNHISHLIKWALDVNRNSNLPVLVGNPLFLVNISCIHFMSILLKPPFFSWQGWNLGDIGFRGPKAQHYNDVLVISYSWQDHARQGHANLEISNTNSRNWVFSPSPLKARRKVLKLCDQLIVHRWEDLWIIQDIKLLFQILAHNLQPANYSLRFRGLTHCTETNIAFTWLKHLITQFKIHYAISSLPSHTEA